MGRRKQDEVVEVENLDEQVSEETEMQEASLSEENEEAEVPKRQRRSRKAKVETEVEAKEEEVSADDEVAQAVEAAEEVAEEAKSPQASPGAPKRQRNSRKKTAATPEAQVELATEAMQKTMEEMVKQWAAVKDITTNVASQLEKVAHIVKPSIQDFTNTSDSLVQPKDNRSQFALRFASAASIVAVLLSLVSMSLSQSARTVALNAEATRVANSQLFPTEAKRKDNSEIAFERAKAAEPKIEFEKPKAPKNAEVFGPKSRASSRKRF